MIVRPEIADDHRAIAEVNRAAFGGPLEATLIERLRRDGRVIASLVAVDDAEEVVGHILFSTAEIVSSAGGRIDVASLAPMAVLPARQR